MSTIDTKEIQAKEKSEVTTTEQTRTGRTFVPDVDIFESEADITLLADMPGVKAGNLNIDLRDNTLTLIGEVQAPESETETVLFREYHTGHYYRQFTLSEVIDQAGINANLVDGVLRLTLPKVRKAAPRKITVTAG